MLAAVLWTLLATADAVELEWPHEGYSSLLEAAAEAKAKQRRMLVGLSGSHG